MPKQVKRTSFSIRPGRQSQRKKVGRVPAMAFKPSNQRPLVTMYDAILSPKLR